MTISLNEIASLVQRIESIIDDSENAIFSVNVSSDNTYVHLDAINFLTEFIEYDIGVDDDDDYPYELKAEIGGVVFMAIMSTEEVVDLKESIPKQWEYIQAKVQVSEG